MSFTPEQYRLGFLVATVLVAIYTSQQQNNIFWIAVTLALAVFTFTLYNPHHMPETMKKVVPSHLTAKTKTEPKRDKWGKKAPVGSSVDDPDDIEADLGNLY